jgi:DmsE family decaheme c-type cytochrome
LRILAFAMMGLLLGATVSCKSSHEVGRRTEPNLDPGWPQPDRAYTQVGYTAVQAQLPTIEGAEYVDDDDICAQCHEAYTKSYATNNVHHNDSCESCHGPASRHVETRGKEPGLVFSFKRGDPVVRAEACLKCHEEDNCSAGTRWRTSKHAQCGTTCVDCHRGHYEVPYGTPATAEPKDTASVRRNSRVRQVSYSSLAESAKSAVPEYKKPKRNLPSLKGTSQDLGAVAPGVCYRCHEDYKEFQQIAGPHQICGPNGFNCTTCHDAHGSIIERSRKDLCLECHKGSPTMAWHMSIHELSGVACTDCHNPHPSTKVPRLVNISHTDVNRPKRLMMSVQEPEACYKCHPKIFAMASLPSHHPIKEGKMTCSDCHDAHGQRNGNLKADGVKSVNQLCYKCHAEKQGPFAYPHPVVDENCAYCHDPHGTVANNLLKQPPTFLCLRCHAGHRNPLHGQQAVGSRDLPSARADIDRNPALRTALYTNCTQCHAQIHGSDLPTGHNPSVLMR